MEQGAGRLSWCSTKNHPMSEKEAKRMQEQTKLQPIPVKIYRTHDQLTVAASMPGLEPEDILIEVTENCHLILHGDMRAPLKDHKEVHHDECSVGGYHKEHTVKE